MIQATLGRGWGFGHSSAASGNPGWGAFCPSGARLEGTLGNTGSQEACGCCSSRWENKEERHDFTSKMLPLVGGRDERAEHGRFLGPLSYSVWYYNHWNALMYLSRPVEYRPRVNPKVIMCQCEFPADPGCNKWMALVGTLREVEVACCWTGGYVAGVGTLSFAVSSAVNLTLP